MATNNNNSSSSIGNNGGDDDDGGQQSHIIRNQVLDSILPTFRYDAAANNGGGGIGTQRLSSASASLDDTRAKIEEGLIDDEDYDEEDMKAKLAAKDVENAGGDPTAVGAVPVGRGVGVGGGGRHNGVSKGGEGEGDDDEEVGRETNGHGVNNIRPLSFTPSDYTWRTDGLQQHQEETTITNDQTTIDVMDTNTVASSVTTPRLVPGTITTITNNDGGGSTSEAPTATSVTDELTATTTTIIIGGGVGGPAAGATGVGGVTTGGVDYGLAAERVDVEAERVDVITAVRIEEDNNNNNGIENNGNKASGNRNVLPMVIGAFIILGIVIVVAVTVSSSRNNNGNGGNEGRDAPFVLSPSPTLSPTQSPMPTISDYQYLLNLLSPISGIETLEVDTADGTTTTGATTTVPPKTPQRRAMEWLLNEDPYMEYNNGESIQSIDTRTILERYAAVLFYYSTSGDVWNVHGNFLTNTSLCDWNNRFIGGFYCELQDSPYVSRIQFGKYYTRNRSA